LILRKLQDFCTFNETLLFLEWRQAKLVRTGLQKKYIDMMPFGDGFSTKHIKIRVGVKGVIHDIL